MVYMEKHIRIINVTATVAIGSPENDVQLRTRHPNTTTDEAFHYQVYFTSFSQQKNRDLHHDIKKSIEPEK
ncbi:Uncharacterised protein [Escherichia coli]|nr:Uncharacterised protein [Escherichia coli]CTT61516.1 Uncharacterised protein [Escherichia coli]CTW35479.1 Uncharacterised protein [Escherichia coli]CTW52090.1 Uncharacterised protein [Escherichia coli]CTW81755.1 Uncharacterised protein [Escherichia coli]